MGLYNFQSRFVPLILSGKKTHTIRATRTNADRPGNTLHLYTGLRTKKAKLLMRAECTRVEEIEIRRIPRGLDVLLDVYIDGVELDLSERQLLARRDGFTDMAEMARFWRRYQQLPFRGQIIHWKVPA